LSASHRTHVDRYSSPLFVSAAFDAIGEVYAGTRPFDDGVDDVVTNARRGKSALRPTRGALHVALRD
jgi:hypothetical protein